MADSESGPELMSVCSACPCVCGRVGTFAGPYLFVNMILIYRYMVSFRIFSLGVKILKVMVGEGLQS